MAVTCAVHGRKMQLRLSGEVDHHRARALMEEIDCLLEAELPRELVLHLGGVTFMDSSGIALLLRAKRRMQGLDGRLQIAAVPAQPEKVLRAAGLYRLLDIVRQEQEESTS